MSLYFNDKENEMFNIQENDKFYLRSDNFSFCNGIHYLNEEKQISPQIIVKILNKVYLESKTGKQIIDECLLEIETK